MAHEHPIIDADKHFTIDPTTRKIMPEKPDKANLVQFDHNSERLTFELPRFIDGHDMLTCNEVWVHFNNIDINTKETNHGVYQVTDLQVSEGQEDTLVCSWLVSQEGTQLVGLLSFVVSFMCAPTEGVVEYRWNTAPYTGISVLNGIFNSDIVLAECADILVEWEERIRAMEEGGGAALSDDLPLADGEASAGESKEAARADHVHPFTGMPSAKDIEFVGGFDDRDNVIFDRNGSVKKTSLGLFKQVLETSLSKLYDSVGKHYASLKELSGDTTLLTEEDRAGIVSEAQEGLTAHNTSDTAHNDIRLLIEGLASRLNALADSDDTTLDQLSELVAYIKANRGLIEGVTTSKVNVSDIIDNLTTNVTDKPLSAAQGVAIKALIDALSAGKLDASVFNSTMANHYNKTQVEAYVQEYAQPKGDYALRSELPVEGKHWNGKKWYAYGTSLTSTSQGKYASHVAEFAGMTLMNKGIPGGAIVANTNIKDAVMNTTDGKLEADLITLEVGANDGSVQLGTIYDMNGSTFCGALNQCIRYLQANTNAQIAVISSTNTNKTPEHEYQPSGGSAVITDVTHKLGSIYSSGEVGTGTRLLVYVPEGATRVRVTDSAYSMSIYAYDSTLGETGTTTAYVGRYQNDGSFNTDSNYITELDLTQLDSKYRFILVVKREDGTNSALTDIQYVEVIGAGADIEPHTRFDQWKAIREVCMVNSVPYIPMGEEGGLGYARMTSTYLRDNIHHTDVGGYNLAQFVWGRLKNIPLWYAQM